MGTATQLNELTNISQPAPKGKGKRSYHKAVRMAQQNGSVQYKAKHLTLAQLGGTLAWLCPNQNPALEKGQRDSRQTEYLSWNAGSLTKAVWEELPSILQTPPYQGVKLVAIQETHWRGNWQFSEGAWHVVSSGRRYVMLSVCLTL